MIDAKPSHAVIAKEKNKNVRLIFSLGLFKKVNIPKEKVQIALTKEIVGYRFIK
jgi:hypothetical protein